MKPQPPPRSHHETLEKKHKDAAIRNLGNLANHPFPGGKNGRANKGETCANSSEPTPLFEVAAESHTSDTEPVLPMSCPQPPTISKT